MSDPAGGGLDEPSETPSTCHVDEANLSFHLFMSTKRAFNQPVISTKRASLLPCHFDEASLPKACRFDQASLQYACHFD